MKKLFAATVAMTLIAITSDAEGPMLGDGKEPEPKNKPAPTLKVGDPAPALKVSRWLQGDALKGFEPGKVYVVEFWAIWCGSCIAFMPDLADVQAQYKDQGLTCIGVAVRDPNNPAEAAAAFVKKRGPKLKYTFAFADDRATWDAWMTAAGRSAIPCSFVVDRAGRIAYLGNPMYLGIVAPMVLDGKMSAEAVSQEIRKVIKERDEVTELGAAGFRTGDHKAHLTALNRFEAKYPSTANNLISVRVKLSLLPLIGEFDEAKAIAEAVMAKAIKQENPSSLGQVAALLRNGPCKDRKDLMAVAVRAADAAVHMSGDQDPQALIDLAETYFAAGDRIKAKQSAGEAVQAAAKESAEMRENIERRARKLDE